MILIIFKILDISMSYPRLLKIQRRIKIMNKGIGTCSVSDYDVSDLRWEIKGDDVVDLWGGVE